MRILEVREPTSALIYHCAANEVLPKVSRRPNKGTTPPDLASYWQETFTQTKRPTDGGAAVRIGGISGIIGKAGRLLRRDLKSSLEILEAILSSNPDIVVLHESPAHDRPESPSP